MHESRALSRSQQFQRCATCVQRVSNRPLREHLLWISDTRIQYIRQHVRTRTLACVCARVRERAVRTYAHAYAMPTYARASAECRHPPCVQVCVSCTPCISCAFCLHIVCVYVDALKPFALCDVRHAILMLRVQRRGVEEVSYVS